MTERHEPHHHGHDPDADWALARLGRDPLPAVRQSGSMSGSGVFRVTLPAVDDPAGVDAVIKVARGDPPTLRLTTHELEVYTELGPQLPVPIPLLIDHHVDDEAVVLLLSAHRTAEPATAWTAQDWNRVAADLAALHTVPAPTDLSWPSGSWVLDTLAEPDPELVARFWGAERGLVDGVLAERGRLAATIAGAGSTLIHGDCHTGNLLREQDTLIWIDWQATGIGGPADDLAFLSVRAVPQGVVPPMASMLTTYAAAREIDPTPLAAAVLATELVILVLAWPQYADYNSAEAVERVRSRVRDLAGAWRRGGI